MAIGIYVVRQGESSVFPSPLTYGRVLYLAIQGLILFNGVIPFSAKIWLMMVRQLQAYRHGQYLKDARYIDELSQIKHLVVDKTGTLTQNRQHLYHYYSMETKQFQPIASLPLDSQFHRALKLCINKYNSDYDTLEDEIIDQQILPLSHPDAAQSYGSTRFTSERKRSSVLTDSGYIYVKGSLSIMKKLLDPHGTSCRALEEAEERYKILGLNYRIIVYGYRQLEKEESENFDETLEKDLIFLGCITLQDQYQPDLVSTLSWLKAQPIRISMATGDNKISALATAEELDLVDTGTLILSGAEICQLKTWTGNVIGYDMTAKDKGHLVKLIREAGECVGTIGDGWNDLEMMKESSVAIGLNGNLAPFPAFQIQFFRQIKMLWEEISYPCYIRNYQALDSTFYRATLISVLTFLAIDQGLLLFDGFVMKAFTFLWPISNLLLLAFQPIKYAPVLFSMNETIIFAMVTACVLAMPIWSCSFASSLRLNKGTFVEPWSPMVGCSQIGILTMQGDKFFMSMATIIIVNTYTMLYHSLSPLAILSQLISILCYLLYHTIFFL